MIIAVTYLWVWPGLGVQGARRALPAFSRQCLNVDDSIFTSYLYNWGTDENDNKRQRKKLLACAHKDLAGITPTLQMKELRPREGKWLLQGSVLCPWLCLGPTLAS